MDLGGVGNHVVLAQGMEIELRGGMEIRWDGDKE